jgi:hypothetical protein
MPVGEEPDHVDTNCFFFLRGSFGVVPHWALMPKGLAAFGDRIFNQMLKRQKFRSAFVQRPTVNYRCIWESLYRAVRETPPLGAKPSLDRSNIDVWLSSLNERELEIAARLAGIGLTAMRHETTAGVAPASGSERISRNSLCPCGSGKKYKRCHGALIP